MKMGFLFRHHCIAKVIKTRPYSHLDSREKKVLDQDKGYILRRRKPPRDNGYLHERPDGTKNP